MGFIDLKDGKNIEQGLYYNRVLESRMVRRNQNQILIVTGATGSGKSYVSLKIAELWYKHHFKKDFPIENCCFSVREIMEKLNSKDLKKGDILILEEGGVNMGNLDFQNKVSKMFGYVLQSFRSMNVCLIINVPLFSLINKTARVLTHANFVTVGIDYDKKTCIIKPFFHQVNQQSGKIYPKYPFARVNGYRTKVKRFNYQLPSESLRKTYEEKKLAFVGGLNQRFLGELKAEDIKSNPEPKELTEIQKRVVESYERTGNQVETAKELGMTQSSISDHMKRVKKKQMWLKH